MVYVLNPVYKIPGQDYEIPGPNYKIPDPYYKIPDPDYKIPDPDDKIPDPDLQLWFLGTEPGAPCPTTPSTWSAHRHVNKQFIEELRALNSLIPTWS